jgi:hypothetical protein
MYSANTRCGHRFTISIGSSVQGSHRPRCTYTSRQNPDTCSCEHRDERPDEVRVEQAREHGGFHTVDAAGVCAGADRLTMNISRPVPMCGSGLIGPAFRSRRYRAESAVRLAESSQCRYADHRSGDCGWDDEPWRTRCPNRTYNGAEEGAALNATVSQPGRTSRVRPGWLTRPRPDPSGSPRSCG